MEAAHNAAQSVDCISMFSNLIRKCHPVAKYRLLGQVLKWHHVAFGNAATDHLIKSHHRKHRRQIIKSEQGFRLNRVLLIQQIQAKYLKISQAFCPVCLFRDQKVSKQTPIKRAKLRWKRFQLYLPDGQRSALSLTPAVALHPTAQQLAQIYKCVIKCTCLPLMSSSRYSGVKTISEWMSC